MPAPSRLDRFNPNRSLRARVGFATVGTTLLLSTLLSLIAGQISRDRIIKNRGQMLANLAYQMADKLDRGMFERYRDIQILASLDAIRQPNVPIDAKRVLIEKLQDTYSDYAWIGLTDETGQVLVSTGQLLEGVSAAERPWFQEAHTKPFAGDVHEALLLADLLQGGTDTGEPLRFVDVAAPVTDEQGAFTGVLGAHLSWSWAEEIKHSLLGPLEQRSQVEVLILSADDYVLLGPDRLEDQTLRFPADNFGSTEDARHQLIDWSDNNEYLTGFALSQGYRDYPGLGWKVVVRQSSQIALAPARALQRQVFAVGALLGGLCAIASWFYARRIVKPILALTDAANRLQQGESGVSMPIVTGKDELAVFSQSLDHLVQTLSHHQIELESANQQLQRQAALLDIATDAIFVRDLEGHIQFWNRGAERIYGWSAEAAIGQDAMTLLNKSVSDELRTAYQTVLTEGEWQGELIKRTRSEQEIVADSRWTLVCNDKGEPVAILTVDTDITETKQLETQLLRAQRLESLGTLASGIAHDLNNVLTPVVGAAQLLPLTLPQIDKNSAQLLEALDSSAKRAGNMVQQILSFARGTDGQRTQLQINDLLDELSPILRSTLPKNITIRIEAAHDLWPVSVDSTQIHQVLMNLCVNARDAMPKGGSLDICTKNIRVDEHYAKLHPQIQAGTYVLTTVADTGTGMPPEVVDRIFDPFFTTKAIGRGTGLGLSTVVGIIKNHGGLVNVYSEVGKGSQFQIYLPVQTCMQAEETPLSHLPTGGGELILVVDDESLIREMAKTALESHNYRVITAEEGHAAITQFQEHRHDIKAVLIDMMMPLIDGATAIEGIRQISPGISIIATSGLSIEAHTLAADEFLPKPYTLQDLLNTVYSAVQSSA